MMNVVDLDLYDYNYQWMWCVAGTTSIIITADYKSNLLYSQHSVEGIYYVLLAVFNSEV